jgi:hypothetical protein
MKKMEGCADKQGNMYSTFFFDNMYEENLCNLGISFTKGTINKINWKNGYPQFE